MAKRRSGELVEGAADLKKLTVYLSPEDQVRMLAEQERQRMFGNEVALSRLVLNLALGNLDGRADTGARAVSAVERAAQAEADARRSFEAALLASLQNLGASVSEIARKQSDMSARLDWIEKRCAGLETIAGATQAAARGAADAAAQARAEILNGGEFIRAVKAAAVLIHKIGGV